MRRMNSDSLGRLGEHYVDEICGRLGCRWRPQHDKSYGLDGFVEVSGKGAKAGDFIFVEVKTGLGNISSSSKTHYSVRVDKEHTDYWLSISHRMAIILVWYDPDEKLAYWTPIRRGTVNPSGTAVRIPKDSRFGLHSSGDLKRLCAETYRPTDRFPALDAANLPGIMTDNIKDIARAYYDQWRAEQFIAPAYGHVAVTLSGWRHLTDVSRSQEEIARHLELLGIARLILASLYTRVRAREVPETETTYYKQTAIIRYKHRANALVSVIVKQKKGHPPTFHSVYEGSKRKKGEGAKIGI